MNRKFKNLIAVIGTLSMLSSVCMAVSANTSTVTHVEVIAEGSETGTTYTAPFDGIVVNPGNLVKVTIDLKDAENAPVNGGEVTFLSHVKDEESLSNENIQYIDQQTTNNGTVTVIFRPRQNLPVGEFIAMAGGENVTQVDSFNYTVGLALKPLTLTASGTASVIENANESVAFTLDPKPEAAEIESVTVGKSGEEATAVTPDYDSESGILTIPNAGVGRTEGTYTVTVSAKGYVSASANFAVTPKPAVTIPDDKKDDVKAEIDSVVPNNSNGVNSVTLPATVTVDNQEYDVSYVVQTGADKVTRNGNTLTLNAGVFAAKVKVTATVGDVVKDKTVYIVPVNTDVNFGNLGLFSKADGSDAFDDDDTVAAIIADEDNNVEIAEELVTALNLALGRGDKAKDIPTVGSLDYNNDGEISLTEYRIFKLLMAGRDGFKPTQIIEARKR